MARLRPAAAVLVVALAFLPAASAATQDDRTEPRGALALPGLSQLLMELSTGQVLYEVDADRDLAPGSLAKLMSLHIAFDAIAGGRLSLDDEVTVGINAWTQRVGGSSMFLEPGDTLSLDMLIRGITVASGNDAAVALAEHVARTEDAFVAVMNQVAGRLGMGSTRFSSASGLSRDEDAGITAARDMAALARDYILSFPEALEYHAQKYLSWGPYRLQSYNGLLWDRRLPVNGLKTGYMAEAGYHLIATAQEGDLFLIAVVMGATSVEDRETTAARLLEYGFETFSLVRQDWRRRIPSSARVWQGQADEVELEVRQETLLVVAPRGIPVDSRVELESPIRAPVTQGQRLGQLVLTVPGGPAGPGPHELARYDIVAAEPVRRGGLLKVILDALRLLFRGWLGREV